MIPRGSASTTPPAATARRGTARRGRAGRGRAGPLPAIDRVPQEPFLRTGGETGISPRTLDDLAFRGLLRQPLRGVLLRADLPDTVQLRAAAARLVLPPGAAICRGTAAWLQGIDARPTGEHLVLPPVECAVPVGRTPVRRPGLRCYVTDLRAEDVEEVCGVPCTTPARTACDLARWSRPGRGLAVLDAMARAGLIDPDELLAGIERWHGDPFVAQARYLLGACDPASESAGESQLRLRLLDAGFPRPTLQIPLADSTGRVVFRLDLGYPEVRWAGEYDGEAFHTGAEAEAHDRWRRDQIERRWRWNLNVFGKALVLGPSMALEYAVGEVLGLQPRIRRRAW